MEPRNKMRLEVWSRPENVAMARVAVATFAAEVDLNVNDLEEIKVAVSEAVANAVVHAYEGNAGVVTVTALLYPDRLEVTVEDAGKGIPDLERALAPGETSDPERLGLGFLFIRSFMDDVEVTSAPGRGTRVRMVKFLPSGGEKEKAGGA